MTTGGVASAGRGKAADPLLLLVGDRIRAARTRLDLSLSQAAVRTGLTKDFLSRAELGKQAITVKSLAQVARGFETSMSEILSGIDLDEVASTARGAP